LDRLAFVANLGLNILEEKTISTKSVDSGAYLISHKVYLDGALIWADPGINFGNFEDIPSFKARGLDPIYSPFKNGRQEAIRARIKKSGSLTFGNDRFYAPQLEYGSAVVKRPRFIYRLAMEELNTQINDIAGDDKMVGESRI
jgi:hypothetical protein